MCLKLFTTCLGFILLGVYTAADSRGGGGFHGSGFHGGFHGGGGFHPGGMHVGGFHGGGFGPGGFHGSSVRAPTPRPGPYYSTHHMHTQAGQVSHLQGGHAASTGMHNMNIGQAHGPTNAHVASHQPPNLPAHMHPLSAGQHPHQPQQWHHANFNPNWANHPNQYPGGHWNHGWYNGYWHNYWADENWEWWGGAYGFWLGLTAADAIFVTEAEPGVCRYWDGIEWVPWYVQGETPYECPY